MELDKFGEKYFDPDDNSGFNDVLLERQFKLKTIRKRLMRYELSKKQIDELFDIIINAEMDMEKIKRKFNAKKYTAKDLDDFYNKLIAIQNKMKEDFDNKLNKMLKAKYEAAKKILEQRKKNMKST